MTEQQRLHHLLDRARRGVILPAEGEQLAALVGELEKSAAINAEVDAQADEQLNGAREVAQYYKAVAEQAQAWGEQHRDRANRYRARTDAVRAELNALNSETAGLNPYAMAGRRDAVSRIRAALQSVSHDTHVPDDPRVTELEAAVAAIRSTIDRTRDAARLHRQQLISRFELYAVIEGLDQPQQPTVPPVHLAKGTNAEDCPACEGTNPDYPFLCPGPATA